MDRPYSPMSWARINMPGACDSSQEKLRDTLGALPPRWRGTCVEPISNLRDRRVQSEATGLARLVVRIRAVIVHVIENKRPSRIEGRDLVPVGRQGPQIDDELVAGVGDIVVGDIDGEGG